MTEIRLVRLRSNKEDLLLCWYDVFVGNALLGSVVYGGNQVYDVMYHANGPIIESGFSFLADAVERLAGPNVSWKFDGWEEC